MFGKPGGGPPGGGSGAVPPWILPGPPGTIEDCGMFGKRPSGPSGGVMGVGGTCGRGSVIGPPLLIPGGGGGTIGREGTGMPVMLGSDCARRGGVC